MKKKTVSNDSLKEKIEEILTPYPDPMSRNDFRIVCHIGTRTSLYLLQNGLVPCKNNGKKTRCYITAPRKWKSSLKSPKGISWNLSSSLQPFTACAAPR